MNLIFEQIKKSPGLYNTSAGHGSRLYVTKCGIVLWKDGSDSKRWEVADDCWTTFNFAPATESLKIGDYIFNPPSPTAKRVRKSRAKPQLSADADYTWDDVLCNPGRYTSKNFFDASMKTSDIISENGKVYFVIKGRPSKNKCLWEWDSEYYSIKVRNCTFQKII